MRFAVSARGPLAGRASEASGSLGRASRETAQAAPGAAQAPGDGPAGGAPLGPREAENIVEAGERQRRGDPGEGARIECAQKRAAREQQGAGKSAQAVPDRPGRRRRQRGERGAREQQQHRQQGKTQPPTPKPMAAHEPPAPAGEHQGQDQRRQPEAVQQHFRAVGPRLAEQVARRPVDRPVERGIAGIEGEAGGENRECEREQSESGELDQASAEEFAGAVRQEARSRPVPQTPADRAIPYGHGLLTPLSRRGAVFRAPRRRGAAPPR